MDKNVITPSLINQLPADLHLGPKTSAANREQNWRRALEAAESALRRTMMANLSSIPLQVSPRPSPYRPSLTPES